MVIIQIYPKNLSVWANQDESNELFSLIVFRLKANIRPIYIQRQTKFNDWGK